MEDSKEMFEGLIWNFPPNGVHPLLYLLSPADKIYLFSPKCLKFEVIGDQNGRVDCTLPEHRIHPTIQSQTSNQSLECWFLLESFKLDRNDLIPEDRSIGVTMFVIECDYVLFDEGPRVLLQL